jgi:hypothetical protein
VTITANAASVLAAALIERGAIENMRAGSAKVAAENAVGHPTAIITEEKAVQPLSAN